MAFSDAFKPKAKPHLIRTHDRDGRACYFVLLLTPSELRELRIANMQPSLDLSQHGEIICSGYGHEISTQHQNLLKEKYKIDPDKL